MDIFDLQVKPIESVNLDKTVKGGQKVLITRMVTFSYEVDVAEVLDGTGESEISLKSLISGEECDNDFSVTSDFTDETDIGDDLVITVEII
jgi:hypothetical protein